MRAVIITDTSSRSVSIADVPRATTKSSSM